MQEVLSDMHSSLLPKDKLGGESEFSKIRLSLTGTEINSKQFKNARLNWDQLPRNQLLAGRRDITARDQVFR